MRVRGPQYKHGDYLVQCDVCGFIYYRSEVSFRWDGLLVCKKDWEPQHPQEFVEGRRDDLSVPNPRPEGEDYFLSDGEVTVDDL